MDLYVLTLLPIGTFSYQILTAGSKANIYHWQTNGEIKTKVPSTPTTLYSLAFNHSPTNQVINLVYCVGRVDIQIEI